MTSANQIKYKVLQTLNRCFTFKITADWNAAGDRAQIEFSCIIPSCRPELLKDILEDLSLQDFPKNDFEIIVIDGPGKVIGSLRNQGLEKSHGQFILFLDDDTRIFQKDFLSKASLILKESRADIIQPGGHSLYAVLQGRTDFLDHFSFASRCCIYTRDLLERLGGFRADLNSYSDIELSIRAVSLAPRVVRTDKLSYYHPPLYFPSLQKPLAIGQSIFKLKKYYPFIIWLLIYLNALRFLPLVFRPTKQNRSWFKISLGVLLYPFRRGEYYHV